MTHLRGRPAPCVDSSGNDMSRECYSRSARPGLCIEICKIRLKKRYKAVCGLWHLWLCRARTERWHWQQRAATRERTALNG